MPWVTGAEAAALTGQDRATVDAAAAEGIIPAQYGDGEGNSWMLMVDPSTYVPHPSTRADEIQHIEIHSTEGGEIEGGVFLLEFTGEWTGEIPYHPTVRQLGGALVALPTVGAGNVLVTKPTEWGYDVKFVNALGSQDVPQLGWDDSGLIGGTVLVTTILEGKGTGPAADLTVAELKEILDARGVEYPSKALKADLIELVEQEE